MAEVQKRANRANGGQWYLTDAYYYVLWLRPRAEMSLTYDPNRIMTNTTLNLTRHNVEYVPSNVNTYQPFR